MDPDVLKLAQLLVVVGAFGGFATALAVAARLALTRLGRKPREPGDSAGRLDDARLERIEQAVDAIAIEVERIAEAQRFTAKLMSERAAERVAERVAERAAERLPAPGDAARGSVTPH